MRNPGGRESASAPTSQPVHSQRPGGRLGCPPTHDRAHLSATSVSVWECRLSAGAHGPPPPPAPSPPTQPPRAGVWHSSPSSGGASTRQSPDASSSNRSSSPAAAAPAAAAPPRTSRSRGSSGADPSPASANPPSAVSPPTTSSDSCASAAASDATGRRKRTATAAAADRATRCNDGKSARGPSMVGGEGATARGVRGGAGTIRGDDHAAAMTRRSRSPAPAGAPARGSCGERDRIWRSLNQSNASRPPNTATRVGGSGVAALVERPPERLPPTIAGWRLLRRLPLAASSAIGAAIADNDDAGGGGRSTAQWPHRPAGGAPEVRRESPHGEGGAGDEAAASAALESGAGACHVSSGSARKSMETGALEVCVIAWLLLLFCFSLCYFVVIVVGGAGGLGGQGGQAHTAEDASHSARPTAPRVHQTAETTEAFPQ